MNSTLLLNSTRKPFHVLLGLLILGSTVSAAEYQFSTFDVPFQAPPNDSRGGTSVYALNDSEVIVGSYGVSNRFVGDSDHHIVDGFVFERGTFRDVSIPNSVIIDLVGVNNRGTIVGDYKDAQGNWFDFVLNRDGSLTVLPPVVPGALIARHALGMNNQGTIVGSYSLDPKFPLSSFQGFILQDGHYTIFNLPGQHGTVLEAINERGTILGRYFDSAQNSHGFLLDKQGSLSLVDVPDAASTTCFGLNNHDEVVGNYGAKDKSVHGFVLSKGVYTTLDVPGSGIKTLAYGINDRGDVVGLFESDNGTEGFFATRTP